MYRPGPSGLSTSEGSLVTVIFAPRRSNDHTLVVPRKKLVGSASRFPKLGSPLKVIRKVEPKNFYMWSDDGRVGKSLAYWSMPVFGLLQACRIN